MLYKRLWQKRRRSYNATSTIDYLRKHQKQKNALLSFIKKKKMISCFFWLHFEQLLSFSMILIWK